MWLDMQLAFGMTAPMTGWNMQFMNHGRGTQTRRPGDNRVALLGIWLAPREPGEETYASATRPYHPGSGEYQTYRTQLRLKSLDKVFQPLVLVGLSCDRGCQSCRQIVLHGGQRRCHLFSGVLREQSQKHCMDGDRSVRWADAPGYLLPRLFPVTVFLVQLLKLLSQLSVSI